MSFRKSIFNFLIFSFVVIIAFLLLSDYFRYSFIISDDAMTLCSSFSDLFSEPFGFWVSSFFIKLFSIILPQTLNIHPSAFKAYYFSYLEAVIILFFVFILNSMFLYKKRLNFLYIAGFVFLFFLLFFFIREVSILWLFTYDGFFRMMMPCFFFAGLLSLNIKKIDNPEVKERFFIYPLTFLCCIANEPICITVTTGSFLYFLFSLKEGNEKFIIKLMPVLISMAGFIVLIKAGTFVRTSDTLPDLNLFLETLKLIPDFSRQYVYHIFYKHIILYVLLFLQTGVLFFCEKENEQIKKKIKLVFCYLFGLLMFYYMLIGLGNGYHEQYYLVHLDLHVILNLILFSFNLVLLNLIISYKHIKDWIMCVILLIFSLFFAYFDYNVYYKWLLAGEIKPSRIEAYKAEKAIRIFNKKEETIIFSKRMWDYTFLWSFYCTDCFEENVLYNDSYFFEFLNQVEPGNITNRTYIFADEETFTKKMAENGGAFEEEELVNIDFNRLKNLK